MGRGSCLSGAVARRVRVHYTTNIADAPGLRARPGQVPRPMPRRAGLVTRTATTWTRPGEPPGGRAASLAGDVDAARGAAWRSSSFSRRRRGRAGEDSPDSRLGTRADPRGPAAAPEPPISCTGGPPGRLSGRPQARTAGLKSLPRARARARLTVGLA